MAECVTCGFASCDLPDSIDPDLVFVTEHGETRCSPCATGDSLTITLFTEGTDRG